MEIIGLREVITMMGSFAVVIALLAATLFGIKKYSAGMGFSGEHKLELLEIKNLGSRQNANCHRGPGLRVCLKYPRDGP